MEEKKDYLMLKAGKSTYFFNIRKARTGKNFLVITQSWFKGEGKEREKSSILIFPEQIKEFIRLTTKAGEKIVEE